MANVGMTRILAGVALPLLVAGALGGGIVEPRASEPENGRLVVLRVFEGAASRPVVQPLVCIREIDQPIGAVGDSLGWVSFGGILPNGTLHLRVISPRHYPADTVVTWPPAENAKPVIVRLRPRDGVPDEPRCPAVR